MSNNTFVKGIANCKLYKRSAPDVKADLLGILEKGESVTILSKTKGSAFEGSDEWYELEGGIFSWAGGINVGSSQLPIKLNNTVDAPVKKLSKLIDKLYDYRRFIELLDLPNEARSKEVTIAILDTGVFADHPDFKQSKFKLSSLYNSFEQINDNDGHGTHLTGLISAKSNTDKGIIGIAPEVNIEHFKVLDDEGIPDMEMLKPVLSHICDNPDDYDIINLSFDITYGQYLSIETQLDSIKDSGIVIVAAAGDDTNLINSILFPAFSKSIISVGAVNLISFNEIKAKGIHPRVDFFFKNDEIVSAFKQPLLYESFAGCSEYTAVLSGLIAILLMNEDVPRNKRFSYVKEKLLFVSKIYTNVNQLMPFIIYKTL